MTNSFRPKVQKLDASWWLLAGLTAIVIVSAILLALGFLNIVPSEEFPLVEGAVSGLLSIGLIIIYLELRNTQKEQTDYLRRDNTPYLFIHSLSFDGDNQPFRLKLKISNLGSVPARDLKLRIEPELLHWNKSTRELEEVESGLDPIYTQLSREDDPESAESDISRSNYLREHTSRVEFSLGLDFPIPDGNTGYFSPENETKDQTIRPYRMANVSSYLEEEGKVGLEYDDYKHESKGQLYIDGEDYKPVHDNVPFNRLRLKFFLNPTEQVNKENHFCVILPLIDPTYHNSPKIWKRSMECEEYNDKLSEVEPDHLGPAQGYDPIKWRDELKKENIQ